MDLNNIDIGKLRINVTGREGIIPIDNATIQIADTGNPNKTLLELKTDSNGNTDTIELNAPPVEYSMEPTDNQPYSEYNIRIRADGFTEQLISGVQIFPDETGIQNIKLVPQINNEYIYNPTVIGGHTLWEKYPPKIPEAEIKPINETGEIVLRRVVVPETIVVHDGSVGDTTATDYYVPYLDYIKNVACCEIYSTWPEATIQANILAIMSFTLNRVYTEWYRNIHLFMAAEI